MSLILTNMEGIQGVQRAEWGSEVFHEIPNDKSKGRQELPLLLRIVREYSYHLVVTLKYQLHGRSGT